jgi:hypothetical protein
MPDRTQVRRHQEWLPSTEWAPLAGALRLDDDRLDRRASGGDTYAVVNSMWLETPLGPGWMSAARLLVQRGQVVVGELRIFPNEAIGAPKRPAGQWSAELLGDAAAVPAGGLSVKVVRRMRLGDYRRLTRQILDRLRDTYRTAQAREAAGLGPVGASSLRARPRRERPGGRPDRFYARLAAAYQRETERGNRRPVATLAKRHGVQPPRMRDMIREARERGLLDYSRQGRAGGVLTPRAQAVLKRQRRTAASRPQRGKRR